MERHFIALLAVAVGVAMAISLGVGLAQSVWFDEAYSIMLAKQSIGQLIHLTSVDTHPPLYYLLLKGWAGLFGWSELALRSLSVLAMGGAVLIGGLLVRRMFGTRTAIVALPFVVFAPFLLRYGFEIRMYSLASLIGIAATYVLVAALEERDRHRQWKLYGLYAVLVALGVYTLYYTVLLWLAHFTWLLWLARRNKQPVVTSPWFAALIGSVILFLPWLPVFLRQVNNGALAGISQAMTIDNLASIVSFSFLYQPTWQLSTLGSLVVLFVIVNISIIATKAFKTASKKQQPYLVLLAMYLAVPIALLALISLARPMYVERYLAHVLIGGSLFLGVIVALATQRKSKRMCIVGSALIVTSLIGVVTLAQVGNYNFQRLQKPSVKEAAAITGNCERGTTIMAADPYVAIELAYYMPSCGIHFYSETDLLSGGYAALSHSPLRVVNPGKQLAGSHRLVYFYYDEPKLSMPPLLKESSEHSFGPLHVKEFSAE